MIPRHVRAGLLAAAVGLALLPLPGVAIAPALLLMIQQIAGQAATSMLKDTLLSGLSGMGCKGMALSNALQALDQRGGAGALMGGLPTMPMNIPPDMAAKLGTMLPSVGQLPPGLAIDSDQMAMVSRMQQMMGQPVSPLETVATIDALTELGFLPKAIQTELKECMVLVPATIPALGMGMGMLKPVIPQLRRAREEMRALSPAEQDEVAAALVEQMKSLPGDQRTALLEHLDSGFFPPRVSAGVKATLAAR
jgi:hypothetical protein